MNKGGSYVVGKPKKTNLPSVQVVPVQDFSTEPG